MFRTYRLCTASVFCLLLQCGGTAPAMMDTIPARGSLGFWVHIEEPYWNGPQPQGSGMTLFALPGLCEIRLDTSGPQVQLGWYWDRSVQGVSSLNFQMPHLPGPAWYYCAFHWDSAAGRFNGFLNGAPMRELDIPLDPWDSPAAATAEATVHSAVQHLEITDQFWTVKNLKEQLTAHPDAPDVAGLVGFGEAELLGDIEPLKGDLLYAPDMGGELAGWRLEGPGILEQAGAWLTMASSEADTDGPAGHIVYWLPRDFPENFIAQWDFQVLSEWGLCIVFFAATGRNGEDIFTPTLQLRDGLFTQYHSGDINNYHCSYYASTPGGRGRSTANLRKNFGFHVVDNGPPGVPGMSKAIHRITVIKEGPHIRIGVDDRLCIDWTDDGQRYGPAHDGGRIGLRQMKWTKARYRDLKVWAVKMKPE